MEVVSMTDRGVTCRLAVKQRGVLMEVLSLARPNWTEYLTIRHIREKVALTDQERAEHLVPDEGGQALIKNDGYTVDIGFTPGELVFITRVIKDEVARVSKSENAVGYLDELFPLVEALGIEVS